MVHVRPTALESLAARLDDPTDLAAHLGAASPLRCRHLPEDEQTIADLAVALEFDVGLREHLVDVLEPGVDPVVPVVSGVPLDTSGQERMPLAVRVPGLGECVGIP